MAKAVKQSGTTERIIEVAIELLRDHPDGIGFSDLVRQISAKDTGLNLGSVRTITAGLEASSGKKVYKPARGTYRLTEFQDAATGELKEDIEVSLKTSIKESDFYESFADWLVNETEECTVAEVLGGTRLGGKWGTPDVIGIRKPKPVDILKYETEIVCAEIKTNTSELITAFGQACAYSLFSHKVYLVVPKNSPADDISRLDRLCQGYGIGLVLFNSEKKPSETEDTEYTIRVRPQKHEPDMYYTNKIATTLHENGKLFI